jgi:hypothetical protein
MLKEIDMSNSWIIGAFLGLLFLLTIAYLVVAFGETEKGCVSYHTNHLMIIGQYEGDVGGCNWLVDRLLYNGSGWHLSGYAFQPQTYISGGSSGGGGGGIISEFEKFVMTK